MAIVTLPTFPVAGGCARRAVRYELTAAPHIRFDDMPVFDIQSDDFTPVARAWRASLADNPTDQG